MTHLENIAKLFAKPHVESPLLETFDAGKLHISSGKIVASDPLTTPDMSPFRQEFPIGDFPINIHRERESNCIAYVEITFSAEIPHRWEMAVTEGQKISDLAEGEIFGYPCESGMGCLMDLESQHKLNKLEHLLYERKGADFGGIYEEFFHEAFFDENGAIDQFALLFPQEGAKDNILAFEAGYGEGFYATYIGLSRSGHPVKLVTEFIEVLAE